MAAQTQAPKIFSFKRFWNNQCIINLTHKDFHILFMALCLTCISGYPQAYWWAVLLMGIALIMLMAGFIKICSVHTPSSNPKLPPPKPLPGNLHQAAFSHLLASVCTLMILDMTPKKVQ